MGRVARWRLCGDRRSRPDLTGKGNGRGERRLDVDQAVLMAEAFCSRSNSSCSANAFRSISSCSGVQIIARVIAAGDASSGLGSSTPVFHWPSSSAAWRRLAGSGSGRARTSNPLAPPPNRPCPHPAGRGSGPGSSGGKLLRLGAHLRRRLRRRGSTPADHAIHPRSPVSDRGIGGSRTLE